MKRRILATIFTAFALTSCARAVELPGIRYEYTQNINAETFTDKGNDLLIECVYGTVKDAEGNGEITGFDEHNYISYKSFHKEISVGDTIRTLLFYDIGNSAPDAIFGRVDYVVSGGKERLVSVWFDHVDEIIR